MNFDGLVGPTHNFAGLAFGNVASRANAGQVSSPRAAVLESLAKMATLHELGVPQGIVPPQERPRLDVLRRLGLTGDDASVLAQAAATPPLLAAVYSASSMWAANAATVTASADSHDGKVHFTPANLLSSFHRSLEATSTARALCRIFSGDAFVHHPPLPGATPFADEGAANHGRLHAGDAAISLFVWGTAPGTPSPARFPARQSKLASETIARQHRIRHAFFTQQATEAIDAGAFHNDVVAVAHERVLLWHGAAFADPNAVDSLRRTTEGLGIDLLSWRIDPAELSLGEAVATYLFNSQLVTVDGAFVLIAPKEAEQSDAARAVVERLKTEGLSDARYLDVRQSMRNGGGPACLRLRVPLNAEERASVHPGCVFRPALREELTAWAERRYRESLAPDDLADPNLMIEVRTALDELTQILDLGSDFYAFQQSLV
ncbi:MAG: N-succinylarginine dihydrolase [Myxococcota bacterium]